MPYVITRIFWPGTHTRQPPPRPHPYPATSPKTRGSRSNRLSKNFPPKKRVGAHGSYFNRYLLKASGILTSAQVSSLSANLAPRIRVNFLKVSPAGEGCGIADCAIIRRWADRKFILRICDDILSRSRATCAAIDSRRRLPFQSPAQIPNPPTQTHRRRSILLFRQ